MANDVPHLLVANFGSSLQIGSRFGFRVATFEDELFGSHFTRLTAPEIVSARQSSYLNYVKSDLWTCGTLAYEIFGSENPFSSASRNGRILTSSSYTDSDLPDLNDRVPSFIQRLVKLMLKNDPSKRPDAVELADALHVILWAPPAWYSTSSSTAVTTDLPSSVEVARWLTMFAASTFCHRPRHRAAGVPRGRSPGGASPVGTATVTEQWSPGRSSPVGTATVTEQLEEEHLLSPVITALKTQFLSRVNIESIFNALRLIRRAETTFDRC
jgi:serine/threonine protein kinase